MIPVASLPFDRQQPRLRHPPQVTARRLGGDPRNVGQLGRRQRTPVHQRHQHRASGRIADQGGDFGNSGRGQHLSLTRSGFRCTRPRICGFRNGSMPIEASPKARDL